MTLRSTFKNLHIGVVALAVAGSLLTAPAEHAEAQTKGAYKAPRTEWGHPNLQGNWSNATLTPFERPTKFGERLIMTPEEAAEIEGTAAKHVEENAKPTNPEHGIEDLPKDCGYGFSGTNCGYNNFWVDRGNSVIRINGQPRASMVVEPANGRLPGYVPEFRQRQAARMAARRGFGPLDGPEARGLGERCLMSFGTSAGPPMLPLMYNNTYSIVQTKDHVMIVVEMVHDTRIIPLTGKRNAVEVPRWMGNSVGRWEGETLVIETTNFHPMQSYRGMTATGKVIERLTRVSPDQILYRVTVEDPSTFTAPFTAELPFNATNELQYEYACHEGNYALPGILAGARAEEKAAAEGGKQVGPRRTAEQDEEGE